MRKILLIDDITDRQKKFLKDIFDLNKYEAILDNKIDKEYKKIEKDFLKGDYTCIQNYTYVFVHGSAFGDESKRIIAKLKEECKNAQIKLIEFSGGNDNRYISEDLLTISSELFYSDNLEYFLKEFKSNKKVYLLMLLYGKKWKSTPLLKTLEKINLYLIENDETKFKNGIKISQFKDKVNMKELYSLGVIKYKFKDRDWVDRDEVEDLKQKIENKIESIINV